MMVQHRLAVLGGDNRQISMAKTLLEYGYSLSIWGLGNCYEEIGNAAFCEDWQDALKDADAVILPLPVTTDGVSVHCPLAPSAPQLRLDVLTDHIGQATLLGGRCSESFCAMAQKKDILLIDYFATEELQLRNALPTAEGAIAIAMQELPVTIFGTVAAVIGYGRIGKLLAQKLRALGADVTVYARRKEARVAAELEGHRSMPIAWNGEAFVPAALPKGCRVLFNTVPEWLFTRSVLETVPKNCVLIDLASAPGGIDLSAARELGLRTVWGTALPGKCTPESAGKILAQAISALLEDSFGSFA